MSKTHLTKTIALLFAVFTLQLVCGRADLRANDDQTYRKGLKRPTQEQLDWMAANMVRTGQVLPNRLAVERVNRQRMRRGERTLFPKTSSGIADGSEIVPEGDAPPDDGGTPAPKATPPGAGMPSVADNSATKHFPPIRTQGTIGSCSAFSATYYTMTHMTALIRDWDVTDNDDNTNKFSPKWTYNMVNGGADDGSWLSDVYKVMLCSGVAKWSDWPYATDGSNSVNYLEWCRNGDIWRDALNYKIKQTGTVNSVDTATGLSNLKQLLANGYVLNFATYIASWQYKAVSDNPGTGDDDGFVGQNACYYVSDTNQGGHAMTVVGYNDDIWIDINNNGTVDNGELGALKIANSWGTGWVGGNSGFIWFAYDALKKTTGVTGGPSANRARGWWYSQAYWITARASYIPKMVARFTINHGRRSDIAVYTGYSTTAGNTPTVTKTYDVLNRHGGAYAFDGTTTACDGEFCLDFSDINPPSSGEMRWYVAMNDNVAGNAGLISDFKLIDVTTGTETDAGGLPVFGDAGYYTIYGKVDYFYQNQIGSLTRTLLPDAANTDGARWRLTTGPDTNWMRSQSVIDTLPVDTYTISYQTPLGYRTGQDEIVTIVKGVQNNANVVFLTEHGSVSCNITPGKARQDGCQWRLTTGPDTGWKNSGDVIDLVPVGNYDMEFQAAGEWNAPVGQNFDVNDQDNIVRDAAFTPNVGSITCTIGPAGANAAGARWRLTAGPDTDWQISGATVANLPLAYNDYTVVFKSVEGWWKPPNKTVTVIDGGDVAVTGDYTQVLPGQDGVSPMAVAGTPRGVFTDADGNRYVAGYFKGTVDFNPGVDDYSLTSAGLFDAYVSKIDADGVHQWTQIFGGAKNDYATGVFVANGTVYVSGYFESTNAGIGGTGTVATAGKSDAFVMALDAATGLPLPFGEDFDGDDIPDGVQTFGGALDDKAFAVAENGGVVYLTGSFMSINAGIGGPGGIGTVGKEDAFILALDGTTGAAVGTFANNGIQTFGGTDSDIGTGLVIDGTGLFVTGYFKGLNAGIGGLGEARSTGATDVFVVGLDKDDGSALTGWGADFGSGAGGVQTFGGTGAEYAWDIAASDPSGKLFVTGSFASANAGFGGTPGNVKTLGGADAFVLALDPTDGSIVPGWGRDFGTGASGVQTFGGTSADEARGIVALDGIAYLAGSFQSVNAGVGGLGAVATSGVKDAFIVALDAADGSAVVGFSDDGVQIFGGSGNDLAYDIHGYLAGGTDPILTIVGDFASTNADIGGTGGIAGSLDILKYTTAAGSFMITLDGSGEAAFGFNYDATGNSVVVQGLVRAIAIDGAGNRYITGSFTGVRDFNPGPGRDIHRSTGSKDAFVTRYSADGSYAWTRTFGGSGNDEGFGIVVDGGVVYVTGGFASNNAGFGGPGNVASKGASDVFVLALADADGAPVGAFSDDGVQTFGGTLADVGYAIAVSGGNLYVAGGFASKNAGIENLGTIATTGANDAFAMALSAADGTAVGTFSNGGVLTFGGTGIDNAYGVAVADGVVYVVGGFSGVQAGFDVFGGVSSLGGTDAFAFAADAATGEPIRTFGSAGIQTFGGSLNDCARTIAVSGTRVFVAGEFMSKNAGIGALGSVSSQGLSDGFVVSLYRADGNSSDGKPDAAFGNSGIFFFGGTGNDYARGMVHDGTSLYVSGDFAGTNAGPYGNGNLFSRGLSDAVLFSIAAASGQVEGHATFGGKSSDYGQCIAVSGGTAWLAGDFYSPNAGLSCGRGPTIDIGGGNFVTADYATVNATNWNGYVVGIAISDLTGNTINNAPVAYPQTIAVALNTPENVTLVAVDPDGGPGPLDFSIVKQPAKGVISNFDPANGTLTYTPKPNLIGLDSFTFRASDGAAASQIATVSIAIAADGVGTADGGAMAVQGNIWAVAVDAAGNRYITGDFKGIRDFDPDGAGLDIKQAVGGTDAFVTKYDAGGTYQWTQTFGGSGNDYGTAIAVSDGAVYVAGYFASTNAGFGAAGGIRSAGSNDVFVLKLAAADGSPVDDFNNNGVAIFGGSASDIAYGIAVLNDDDDALDRVFVTGRFASKNAGFGGTGLFGITGGSTDAFVFSLDMLTGQPDQNFGNNGVRIFGGTGIDIAYGISVIDDADDAKDALFVTGTFASVNAGVDGLSGRHTSGGYDVFVAKFATADGTLDRAFGDNGVAVFGGALTDIGYAVATGQDRVFVTGSMSGTNAGHGKLGHYASVGGNDAFVLSLDWITGKPDGTFGDNGVVLFGGSGSDVGWAVTYFDDGGNGRVYVAGAFASVNAGVNQLGAFKTTGGQDAFAAGFDATTGEAVGIQKFGGSGSDVAYGVAYFDDDPDALIVVGSFKSVNAGIGGLGTVNYTGWDGFLYQADPAGLDAINSAPVARGVEIDGGVTDTVTAGFGGIRNFKLEAIDKNADPLTYTIVKQPAAGNVSVAGAFPNVTYTHNGSTKTSDFFTFKVSDGVQESKVFKVFLAATEDRSIEAGDPQAAGYPRALAIDADGNRYLAGSFTGTMDFDPDGPNKLALKSAVGKADVFVTKFNNAGVHQWTRTFGGKDDDLATGLAVSGGSVYVTGHFKSVDADVDALGGIRTSGNYDVFVMKLDAITGDPDETFNNDGVAIFGGTGIEYAGGIAVAGGNVYVVGSLASKDAGFDGVGAFSTVGGFDAFVLSLDATTGTENTGFGTGGVQTFGGTGADDGYAVTVSGGTLYAAGSFSGTNAGVGSLGAVASSGGKDTFVLALDAGDGSAVPAFSGDGVQVFGGSGNDVATCIVCHGGNVFVGGHFASSNARVGDGARKIKSIGAADAFVLALAEDDGEIPDGGWGRDFDGDGPTEGIQVFGGSKNDFGMALMKNNDGSMLYLAGTFLSSNAGHGFLAGFATNGAEDAFMVKINSANGQVEGKQKFGGSMSDYGYAAACDPDSNKLYLAGDFKSTNAGIGAPDDIDFTNWNGYLIEIPDGQLGSPAPNSPPVAMSTAGSTGMNQSCVILLPAYDPDDDALTFVVAQPPSHGSVSIHDNLAVYVPDKGFIGNDLFTFRAWDGRAYSDPAVVFVSVSAPGFDADSADFSGPFLNDPLGATLVYDGFGTLAGQTRTVTFVAESKLGVECLKISETYSNSAAPDTVTWIGKDSGGRTWLFGRNVDGTDTFIANDISELVLLNTANFMPELLAAGIVNPGSGVCEPFELSGAFEIVNDPATSPGSGAWTGETCVETSRFDPSDESDATLYYEISRSVGGQYLRKEWTVNDTPTGWELQP